MFTKSYMDVYWVTRTYSSKCRKNRTRRLRIVTILKMPEKNNEKFCDWLKNRRKYAFAYIALIG